MEQAYNPEKKKQVIEMKNISITTYHYKVIIVKTPKEIHIHRDKGR